MSGSVAERRSYPSRSSSLPGIPEAIIGINPLHRIVTVGRSSLYLCGFRGLRILPALNRFSPSRENAPLRGRFRYCGSKWSSTPSNPPPWSLVWRKRKSRLLSSLSSSSSPSCSRFELSAGLARGLAYCIVLYHPVFIQYSVKVSSVHFLSVAAALVFHLKYIVFSNPSQFPLLVFSSFKSVVSLGFSFHLHRFTCAVRANPVRFRYCVCV
jgi:hypothetical protein